MKRHRRPQGRGRHGVRGLAHDAPSAHTGYRPNLELVRLPTAQRTHRVAQRLRPGWQDWIPDTRIGLQLPTLDTGVCRPLPCQRHFFVTHLCYRRRRRLRRDNRKSEAEHVFVGVAGDRVAVGDGVLVGRDAPGRGWRAAQSAFGCGEAQIRRQRRRQLVKERRGAAVPRGQRQSLDRRACRVFLVGDEGIEEIEVWPVRRSPNDDLGRLPHGEAVVIGIGACRRVHDFRFAFGDGLYLHILPFIPIAGGEHQRRRRLWNQYRDHVGVAARHLHRHVRRGYGAESNLVEEFRPFVEGERAPGDRHKDIRQAPDDVGLGVGGVAAGQVGDSLEAHLGVDRASSGKGEGSGGGAEVCVLVRADGAKSIPDGVSGQRETGHGRRGRPGQNARRVDGKVSGRIEILG